jgi:hypothetical protein
LEWQTDGELDELDRFVRGETGPGSGTAMLEALAGLVALRRADPRASAELRVLRAEAQRLRQNVALASADVRRLEGARRRARSTASNASFAPPELGRVGTWRLFSRPDVFS